MCLNAFAMELLLGVTLKQKAFKKVSVKFVSIGFLASVSQSAEVKEIKSKTVGNILFSEAYGKLTGWSVCTTW